MQEKINIVNKKANFKYILKKKYVAGLVLTGLQIKAIKAKKIVIEATEQSNQLIPPEISQVTKLKDFLNNLDSSTKLLFADINSKDDLKKELLNEAKSLSVLVGPEGDFSPSEIEVIRGNPNVVSFTISRNILRTDTAVISAISLVNFINNFH